jgi:hypothetical protein
MTQSDELMHEAHTLAETIRQRRAQHIRHFGHADDGLAVMERRLTTLWNEIRAARAVGSTWGVDTPSPPRTRPKWE